MQCLHRDGLPHDLEFYGRWVWTVGEGRQQLSVYPPVRELRTAGGIEEPLGPGDGTVVVVVLGDDLHEYFWTCESLRHAANTYRHPPREVQRLRSTCSAARARVSAEQAMNLRTWFGLDVSTPAPVALFFGDEQRRSSLIDEAEERMGITLFSVPTTMHPGDLYLHYPMESRGGRG